MPGGKASLTLELAAFNLSDDTSDQGVHSVYGTFRA